MKIKYAVKLGIISGLVVVPNVVIGCGKDAITEFPKKDEEQVKPETPVVEKPQQKFTKEDSPEVAITDQKTTKPEETVAKRKVEPVISKKTATKKAEEQELDQYEAKYGYKPVKPLKAYPGTDDDHFYRSTFKDCLDSFLKDKGHIKKATRIKKGKNIFMLNHIL